MNSELMRRAAITLGALLVYRIGIQVPLPGINVAVWDELFKSQAGGLLGMANIFAGGGINRMAILALNLIPYLIAAQLVQLHVIFWPRLRALNERGDRGRRIIQQCTLGLTVLLAVFQSLGIAVGLESAGSLVADPGLFFRITAVVTLTGGTFFLIWLSELITVRGLGNGLAWILFVGIATEVLRAVYFTLQLHQQGIFSNRLILGLAVLTIALVAFIVFMELARRHVPVDYPERLLGEQTVQKRSSTLAFKLNGAGAIPLILAGWLLSLLVVWWQVAVYALTGGQDPRWFSWFEQFQLGHSGHLIYSVIAVVAISLIYVALLIGPDQVAEKLKRYGSIVPGFEPGEATADHIDKILSRTTLLGGAYLAAVVFVSEAVTVYAQVPFIFGALSALIVVCTLLDLQAQVRGYNFITISRERQQ